MILSEKITEMQTEIYKNPIHIDGKRYYYRDEDDGKYVLTDDNRKMYIFDAEVATDNRRKKLSTTYNLKNNIFPWQKLK